MNVRQKEGEVHRCPTCSGIEEEFDFSRDAGYTGLQILNMYAIFKVSKGDSPRLQGRRVGQLYRLEGSVLTRGATVKHGSNGTRTKKSGQGARWLHRCTGNWRRRSRRAHVDPQVRIVATQGVQELREVHKEAQSNGMRSCLKSCTAPATPMTRRISFAPNLISE